ncbi:MAG: hypothetical protein AAFQ36_13340 [Pseudomonadota bacterium]
MDRRFVISAVPALAVAASPLRAAIGTALEMRDLYESDMSFTEEATALAGERVSFTGFMAPPLRAAFPFFVLTKVPMAVCPFCDDAAQWPPDILAVYTKRVLRPIPFHVRVETRGVLELGAFRDPETGFVSRVRLTDAVASRA